MSGGTYTQNFDSLLSTGTANTWTNNSTVPYWYASATATTLATYRAGTGSDNNGALYSFGASGKTDRALGSAASNAVGGLYYGVCLVNDTSQATTSIDIAYNGEQWRNGGNATAQKLDFTYQANATGLTSGTWTDLDTLDFAGPVATATAAAVDGNSTGRKALSANLPVAIMPGQTIWLRWYDANDSGNDHGLAIDDVTITPHAGPPTTTLSINDVSASEGASGLTTFTFTVSLSGAAPASGVTFDIATADGTATAGSDYIAKSLTTQLIPSGSTSYTFAVDVIGDVTPEANETFSVNVTNVSGVAVNKGQGVGTILNDDSSCSATPIHSVQGSGAQSPLSGQVTVEGIVTAKTGSGFFMQEEDFRADSDPATSEGIYIYTKSAPTASVKDRVCVTGTISEYPTGTSIRTLTELGTPSITVEATNQPLPAPINITVSELSPGAPWNNLERYEGMRVALPTMRAVSGSSTAYSFYAVPASVGTPYREPGIEMPFSIPAGASGKSMPPIPKFDANPEVVEIDTNISGLAVTPGMTISNYQGVVNIYSGRYSIYQEDGNSPTITGSAASAVPLAAPAAGQITIASFNMLNLTSANATKQAKAVRAVRDILRNPDVLGVEEVDAIGTLNTLAASLNTQPGMNYRAYLGTSSTSSQNVGVLVNTARVTVLSAGEILAGDVFVDPSDHATKAVHDRAPFLLKATAQTPGGTAFPFSVMVLHVRSLIGIEDDTANGYSTEGDRIRTKRLKQAESIRQYLQSNMATGDRMFVVGDFNSFAFNDGYVDFTGILRGNPVPDEQVVLPGSPFTYHYSLIELADTRLAATERWSATYNGNLEQLDHILASPAADSAVANFQFAHFDATFPEAWSTDANRPEAVADHDVPLAYVTLPNAAPTAADQIVIVPFSTAATFALKASDDSGSVTIAAQTAPARGTVHYSGLQATYTPFGSASGGDSFAFRASDAGGLSATGRVKVQYNLTGVLAMTFGGVVIQPITKEYRATLRVQNPTAWSVTGPVHVVFDSLPAGVVLKNASGTTADGKPYITLSDTSIASGAVVSVTATFSNPSNLSLSPMPISFLNGSF